MCFRGWGEHIYIYMSKQHFRGLQNARFHIYIAKWRFLYQNNSLFVYIYMWKWSFLTSTLSRYTSRFCACHPGAGVVIVLGHHLHILVINDVFFFKLYSFCDHFWMNEWMNDRKNEWIKQAIKQSSKQAINQVSEQPINQASNQASNQSSKRSIKSAIN